MPLHSKVMCELELGGGRESGGPAFERREEGGGRETVMDRWW